MIEKDIETINKLFRSLYIYSKIPIFLLNKNRSYVHKSTKKSLFQNKHLDELFSEVDSKPAVLIINSLEIYGCLPIKLKGSSYFVGIGPGFLSHPQKKNLTQISALIDHYNLQVTLTKIKSLRVTSVGDFSNYIRFIYTLLTNETIDHNSFSIKNMNILSKEFLNEKFSHRLFRSREDIEISIPYQSELMLLSNIRSGDLKAIQKFFLTEYTASTNVLSQNTLTHFKYQSISLLTVISREAIRCGVDSYLSLELANTYIELLDTTLSVEQILSISLNAAKEYANRITDAVKNERFSNKIQKCLSFIRINLYQDLSLNKIALAVDWSPSHLSSKFKAETGMTITEFIQREKIDEAKKLLRYTKKNYSEISNYLCFANQSYFISVFKKYVRQTPRQYREHYLST